MHRSKQPSPANTRDKTWTKRRSEMVLHVQAYMYRVEMLMTTSPCHELKLK